MSNNKRIDNFPKKFDTSPYNVTVESSSMRPLIDVGDVICFKPTKIKELRNNDVICFYNNDIRKIVIHRIIHIFKEDTSIRVITKGDNNTFVDRFVVDDFVLIGKAMSVQKGPIVIDLQSGITSLFRFNVFNLVPFDRSKHIVQKIIDRPLKGVMFKLYVQLKRLM